MQMEKDKVFTMTFKKFPDYLPKDDNAYLDFTMKALDWQEDTKQKLQNRIDSLRGELAKINFELGEAEENKEGELIVTSLVELRIAHVAWIEAVEWYLESLK